LLNHQIYFDLFLWTQKSPAFLQGSINGLSVLLLPSKFALLIKQEVAANVIKKAPNKRGSFNKLKLKG
tara:strand:- start:433 stop:636 length:204 start_codon:yes stop_codon:yes gene_type:complete